MNIRKSYSFLHICCLSGHLRNLSILLESFAETSKVQYLFVETMTYALSE